LEKLGSIDIMMMMHDYDMHTIAWQVRRRKGCELWWSCWKHVCDEMNITCCSWRTVTNKCHSHFWFS
jgi:hypothetical protein